MINLVQQLMDERPDWMEHLESDLRVDHAAAYTRQP